MFDYFYGAQSDQFSFYRVPNAHLAELTIGREGQEQSETAPEKAGAETHSVLADLKAKQSERPAVTPGHAKHKEEIR